MPFTPSHAVVALPFVRTPLVPAAVAVGAMTPDLPLFVGRIGVSYGMTHAWSWMPTTVAIALALLLVWRCVLRPAARELAPDWLAARLPSSWDGGAVSALRETFPSLRGSLWLGRRPSEIRGITRVTDATRPGCGPDLPNPRNPRNLLLVRPTGRKRRGREPRPPQAENHPHHNSS